MSDEPVFFDYESEEYKSMMAAYDQVAAVHEAINTRRSEAKKQFDEADIDYHISQRWLDDAWKPIGDWYQEQSRLRDKWMHEHQDKEPGNE